MKLQPIYLGHLCVVKRIYNKAYQLDLDSYKKTPRVVNVQHLTRFVYRRDAYPRMVLQGPDKRNLRGKEVIALVGYDSTHKTYLCKLRYVDPTVTVEYHEAEFNAIPDPIRKSVLANFLQLYQTQVNPEGKEDVVSRLHTTEEQTSMLTYLASSQGGRHLDRGSQR